MPTPAALDVMVERIVGQIGLPASVPAECGRRPLEDAIPFTEPRQLFCRSPPKCFWILPGILNPALHNRAYQIHESLSFLLICLLKYRLTMAVGRVAESARSSGRASSIASIIQY